MITDEMIDRELGGSIELQTQRSASEARGVSTDKMIHRKLSESIIGAAMKVLNTLKPGLSEKAYENALVVELEKRGHSVQQQQRFEVRYEGILVDTLVPDLIVDDAVIADPKVVSEFNDTHISQMIGYLAITDLQLALLLNFKNKELRWKRVVR